MLSDRTEEMALQAEAYANTAHQLMLKYKDKKWYQFQMFVRNTSDT